MLWFVLVTTLCVVTPGSAYSICPDPPGDLNKNGSTDIVDVQCSIKTSLWVLGGNLGPQPPCSVPDYTASDVNCDGNVNVQDILIVILLTLKLPLDPVIDGNGDDCPDACGVDPCGDEDCADGENCSSCAVDCGVCAGGCCVGNDSPGCELPSVTQCVCNPDPFCCTVYWDEICVGQATNVCGLDCPPTEEDDCCVSQDDGVCSNASCADCVCATDDYCCEIGWDESCGELASSNCYEPCGCDAPKETCCASHEDAGCAVPGCEACICAEDEYCCEISWDPACVSEAETVCALACGCVLDLPCCAVQPGQAGCGDELCELCVCDADVDCCEVEWTAACGAKAGQICSGECGCEPLAGGDCCDGGSGVPGCTEAACQSCVCETHSFCCGTAWDDTCVEAAESTCAPVCSCADPGISLCCTGSLDLPGCADAACEACVCAVDSSCCDTAWDAACVDEASQGCTSECGCLLGDDCCTAKELPGCSLDVCESCVCEADPVCCDLAWDLSCAVEAIIGCDAACSCDIVFPGGTGDCCAPNGTVGCDDVGCQGCVCIQDAFCCVGVWDLNCSKRAAEECVAACPECEEEVIDPDPVEKGSCCEESEATGCDEPSCEDCVCGIDVTCCDDVWPFWDSACVDVAEILCTDNCSCFVPPPDGACCEDNGSPGCEEEACEEAVCQLDSFCCIAVWDIACAYCAAGGETFAGDDCTPAAGICQCDNGVNVGGGDAASGSDAAGDATP